MTQRRHPDGYFRKVAQLDNLKRRLVLVNQEIVNNHREIYDLSLHIAIEMMACNLLEEQDAALWADR